LGIALLLGLASKHRLSLRELMADVPDVHYVHRSITCPWESKAGVMRRISLDAQARRDVEGMLLEHDGARVLVVPSSDYASYELFVEASSWEVADEIGDLYTDKIRTLIQG